MRPPHCAGVLLAIAALVIAAPVPAATRLSGRVLDADTQRPVANADVELLNAGGMGYFRTTTDAEGAFAIERVPNDRYYTLTVGATGFTDWVADSWRFPPAQEEARLTIPLDRAGELGVTLTAADGRTPVRGARVRVSRERAATWWESGPRDPQPRFSDRDGRATFDGLSAGYWTVQVDAEGLRSLETRRVSVRRGESTPLPLMLTRPASLAGVVRLPDSTGAPGVTVVVRGPAEGTGTTDAEGRWAIGELAPGRYRVEAAADGFEPGAFRDGVVLREGEAKAGVNLRAVPRPASFAWVLQREVFAPPAPDDDDPAPGRAPRVRIGLRAFRTGALDLRLWRVPDERLLDPARDVRALAQGALDSTGLRSVERWVHEPGEGAPFAWREEEVPMPRDLPPGAYLLQGRSGRLERRVVFFVSDLSLLVKRSASRAVIWCGSLRTGVPVEDAALFVLGASPAAQDAAAGRDWSGALAAARAARRVTDADGLFSLPLASAADRVRIVAVSARHGVAVVDAPLAGVVHEGGDAAFVFTDRPIYRPGQDVLWKLFARRGAGAGYALPDRTRTELTLTGPDGETLDIAPATLSGAGTADGRVTLPADAPLGEWTLGVRAGRAQARAAIAVQEYRKPEFQVAVRPERELAINGDEVRFTLAADYFFGSPVFGAAVRYNLYETRLAAGAADPDAGGEGYGRVLRTGETRTDLDGRAALTFATERVAYDRRLTLEVEVVDGAQRAVSARGSAIVARGAFTIALEPASRMIVRGEPAVVVVHTRDHAGAPVGAAVTVELDQDVWNPLERRWTRASRPLAALEAATSATQGRTRVTIPAALLRAGALQLRARASDARGNRITAEASFWVHDPRAWGVAHRWPALDVLPDRAQYAPGDSLRVVVQTDHKDATVLATLEGRELYDARILHLFGHSGIVAFALTAEHAPNAFVTVHVRRGRDVHTRVVEIPVRAARHDLRVSLTPDRAEVRPRDEVRLQVETRDAGGRPQPAELAVGVVDEAIYALRPDGTPDPHDVFFGRRANAVATVASFPTLYYGGADKGGHDEPRRDFRDVALWAPRVQTDAEGRAEVRFRVPDNLTTWRATARGATAATLVGDTTARVRVTKDLVARLALPRHLVAGDEGVLVSVVGNRAAAPVTGVEEELAVRGGAALAGRASVTTSLAAGGESRSRWTVTATKEPVGGTATATFTFRARGPADRDAVEQAVPVRPRAVALRLVGAGALAAAGGTAAIDLPRDLVREGSAVTVSLASSPAALALAAADWLNGFEWACTEQSANAILPAAALLRATAREGRSLPGWTAPERRLAGPVQRLLALQRDDGAWGWWAEGEADAYLTALATHALAAAARAGVRATDAQAAAERALFPLSRMLAEVRSEDGEAYVAMHLASAMALLDSTSSMRESRPALADLVRGLAARRDRLGRAGLGCAAIAAARLELRREGRAFLDAVLAQSRMEGVGRIVPAADGHEWFGEATENTAYALEALARLAPADPRGPELVRGLAARRAGRAWRTTRVSGPAVIALATWLEQRPFEWAGAGRVRVRLGGELVLDHVLGGDAAAETSVVIPGAKLAPGPNALALEKDGAGPLDWSWSALALVPSPGPPTDRAQLALRREFLRAERSTDRRGRPQWRLTPLAPGEAVRLGERLAVRLVLASPSPRRWLMIEAPRPAGFELDPLDTEGLDRPWNAHGESRDERTVFFVDRIDSGDTVIEYLLRPEMAGRFTALPAAATGMYDPSLAARSDDAVLRVVDATP